MINKYIYNILSFYEFHNFINKNIELSKDLVCVGIHSEEVDLKIYKHFKDFIFLQFDDVSNEDLCEYYYCISEYQIKELIDFILENKNEKFLVHCEAGISRSAAIAMAITCILKYDGNKYWYLLDKNDGIRNNSKFYPNLFVFNKIIDFYNKFNKKSFKI